MSPRRVLSSPTRILTLLLIAGLLLTGSFDPFTGSTGDARMPPTTVGEETDVTFQCYQATIETNTTVTAILHFPDGGHQQFRLPPGSHVVRGTEDDSGKPLTAITIESKTADQRYDNPRYPGCEGTQTATETTTATSTTTETTTTETTTTTPAPTTTTSTTTSTTTTTATPTTSTTPPPTSTTSTTATTPPTTSTTTVSPTTTATETPSPRTTTTTSTATSVLPSSTATPTTTNTTGTVHATKTGTERGSSTAPATSTTDSKTVAGGVDLPDGGDGSNPGIEWTIGDVLALLVLGAGGILIAGPSMYSRVAMWWEN
ncbi:hypothetical protein [Haladaptatus sp. NG-SE-30]